MTQEEAKSLFSLAGFQVLKMYQLANGYIPIERASERDFQYLQANPWWLAKTDFGLIRIGWRKRVISIDWSDTPFRGVITEDDVTKDGEGVHAYSYVKALEYLTALNQSLTKETLKH